MLLIISMLASREAPEGWLVKSHTEEEKLEKMGEELKSRALLFYLPGWVQWPHQHSQDEGGVCLSSVTGGDTESLGHQSGTVGKVKGGMIDV